jgi:tRNA uridine 5-carbamoylmethylation protein Kti12
MRYAFIMRGIPGSGKSTVASMLRQAFIDDENPAGNYVVHSTDDLCMVDGESFSVLRDKREDRRVCVL